MSIVVADFLEVFMKVEANLNYNSQLFRQLGISNDLPFPTFHKACQDLQGFVLVFYSFHDIVFRR